MSAGPHLNTPGDTPDSDLRKRAAWLLALLAVVAGLVVVLFVTLGGNSGGSGEHATISEPSVSVPAAPTSSSAPAGRTSARATTSAASTSAASTSAASSAAAATSEPGSPTTTAPSSPVAKPSCPSSATCSVSGDVAGAQQAIDAFRAAHQRPSVPVTQDPVAQRCAQSSGTDCPQAFVWVRVSDLSGASVVKGVSGFNGSDDLLGDKAASFGVGWAYDPGSKLLSCAVVRND